MKPPPPHKVTTKVEESVKVHSEAQTPFSHVKVPRGGFHHSLCTTLSTFVNRPIMPHPQHTTGNITGNITDHTVPPAGHAETPVPPALKKRRIRSLSPLSRIPPVRPGLKGTVGGSVGGGANTSPVLTEVITRTDGMDGVAAWQAAADAAITGVWGATAGAGVGAPAGGSVGGVAWPGMYGLAMYGPGMYGIAMYWPVLWHNSNNPQ